MKLKVIQLLFFIFIINTLSAQNFVGKWKASNKGASIFLEIKSDSTFLFYNQKDTLIGNPMIYQDSLTKAKLQLDTTKNPRQIDLLMIGKNVQDKIVVYSYLGIYEILSEDRIRIRFNFGQGERPISFYPKGNTETFVFVKLIE